MIYKIFEKATSASDSIMSMGVFVGSQFREDPVHFALLASRRFASSKGLGFVSRLLSNVAGRSPAARAWSFLIAGKTDELPKLVNELSQNGTVTLELSIVADICLLAGLPDLSGQLLMNRNPDDIWICRSRARLAWFLGDMGDAIEILQARGEKTARQVHKYQSELDTFSGKSPQTVAVKIPADLRRGVVHLVTNSLPHTGSGYAQRTHSVLLSLVDRGMKVNVVTRLGYPVTVGKLRALKADVVDSVTYSRLLPKHLLPESVPRIQQQTEMLAEFVLENKPAVLHTTTDFTNALSTRSVAEAFEIPWIYEVRGQLANTWASTRPESATESERFKLFERREAELSLSASAVVTLGTNMRNDLIRRGVSPQKIVICPNAVGQDYVSEPIPRVEARKAVGLDADLVYIGTVSSLVSYEGLDDLIRAFAILRQEDSRVRLLVVGDGADFARLVAIAVQLQVIEFCIFPGRVAREMARTYHCALDIFVVPRKDLAVTRAVTPLKPVEAMACRIPVVASDLPALLEIVTHEETGLVCKAESPAALADAIRLLINNPKLREELGQRARDEVLRERTWASNAAKLATLYSELTANGHASQRAVE